MSRLRARTLSVTPAIPLTSANNLLRQESVYSTGNSPDRLMRRSSSFERGAHIDSKMAKLIIGKQAVMDAALDGGARAPDRDIFTEVMAA